MTYPLYNSQPSLIAATEANAAAIQYLNRIAGYMAAPNMNGFKTSTSADSTAGLVLLPRTWAQAMSSLGYSEAKVQKYLWDNSQLSYDYLQKVGMSVSGLSAGQSRPVSAKPEQITIVISGGAQSAHAYWLQTPLTQNRVTVGVKLPARWNDLIKAAEKDLGPLPAPMQ